MFAEADIILGLTTEELDALEDYEDIVDRGVHFAKVDDHARWALGDLATRFEIKIGRPRKDDPDAPKLKDLAKAWQRSVQRVSEYRLCSEFYPTASRRFSLSWEVYNLARRKSNNSLKQAEELLTKAVLLHVEDAEDLDNYLSGTYFVGVLKRSELPDQVQLTLPSDVMEVMTVVKRYTPPEE